MMADHAHHPRVVAGVHDSPTALAALCVAVAEARRRGWPLYAVHAETGVGLRDPEFVPKAFTAALGAVPADLEIVQGAIAATAVDAIRRAATDPRDLIVIGHSCRGFWHALWSGCPARAVLRRAECAVLAVPVPRPARTMRRARRQLRSGHTDVWERFEHDVPQIHQPPRFVG